MRAAPGFVVRPPRRRRGALWRRVARGVGVVLFSPIVVLAVVVRGRSQVASNWVRGFLAFGMILFVVSGVVFLIVQASDQEVFAALGRFEAAWEQVPHSRPFAAEVNAAASRYGLNPMAVHFVMQIESAGRPLLVSPRGARGLMQIMPGTWRALNPDGVCRGDHPPGICPAGEDCIFAPWGNIRTGALYLSRLLDQYDGDYLAALQAYNAGQGHVVFSPQAEFPETRRYVSSFLRLFDTLRHRQLTDWLARSARYRGLVRPLLFALGAYMTLATVLFWRRHRPLY